MGSPAAAVRFSINQQNSFLYQTMSEFILQNTLQEYVQFVEKHFLTSDFLSTCIHVQGVKHPQAWKQLETFGKRSLLLGPGHGARLYPSYRIWSWKTAPFSLVWSRNPAAKKFPSSSSNFSFTSDIGKAHYSNPWDEDDHSSSFAFEMQNKNEIHVFTSCNEHIV